MAIFGIVGGIGSGKTLSLVSLGIRDMMKGRKLLTNVKLKNIGKYKKQVTYLTKDYINNIFEMVKTGKLSMRNSTVMIQEAHNYIDSRNSMTKKNKAFTYWILQSRHTGGSEGCDIIFDTQSIDQVDVRLRSNMDYVIKPHITKFYLDGKHQVPIEITLDITGKVKHKVVRLCEVIDVSKYKNMYDTHELVDF